MLKDRNILLGVTGSIAAYKAVDIARRLKDEGADVRVVMTEAACRFITPYTFEAVTGNPARTDLFKDPFSHINLSVESDLFIIAPATANTINKLSCGIADNLLTTLWLTYDGPSIVAPAMNFRMYRHASIKKHIGELKKCGVQFSGPVTGSLACGEEGKGRMVEVPVIVDAAISALTLKDLAGRKILITAGPTREPLDPVRFISNRSSGKMGFALAKAATRRGADVTLISGPTHLKPPEDASFIPVEKASEMEIAVMKHWLKADTVIMAAAISDFAPAEKANVKLKKSNLTSIKLRENTDILRKLGKKKGSKFLVGFAAETGNDISSAKNKLKTKNLDMIVFNDVSQKGAGFDVNTNIVTIIDKKGSIKAYPKMMKIDVANVILDRIKELT